MANFNYMDSVPVKIAEKYKPPPRIYQIPQTILNRLNQAENYYEKSPEFSYDFRHERQLTAETIQWQAKRQTERLARHERKEKRREQQRIVQVEQQIQMLGNVEYPSTDDFSPTDIDQTITIPTITTNATEINEKQSVKQLNVITVNENSFHNILQPTICSTNTRTHTNLLQKDGSFQLTANAFNYKDFEEDTSSPFDNIELKTINELDILAQVLHSTHIKPKEEENQNETNIPVENDLHVDNSEMNIDSNINTINGSLRNPIYSINDFKNVNNLQDNHSNQAFLHTNEQNSANLPSISLATIHQSNANYFSPQLYGRDNKHIILNHNNGELIPTNNMTPKHMLSKAIDVDHTIKSKSVPDILQELRNDFSGMQLKAEVDHNLSPKTQLESI